MTKTEISKLMSSFGKLAKGKPKKFTEAEIKKRTERLKKYSKHNK